MFSLQRPQQCPVGSCVTIIRIFLERLGDDWLGLFDHPFLEIVTALRTEVEELALRRKSFFREPPQIRHVDPRFLDDVARGVDLEGCRQFFLVLLVEADVTIDVG